MIYVTGDTHGDFSRILNAKRKLKKKDSLIICGDFGFIWNGSKEEKSLLKKIGKCRFNVLFVEGVHENFDALEGYPFEEWQGGKTRLISGNLRQLIRGNIFDIEGKKIFAFGGGKSEENDSFIEGGENEKWRREIPTESELSECDKRLGNIENKLDYIISYEAPAQLSEFLELGTTDRNHINTYLEAVRQKTSFVKWFFGSHHINKLIPPKYFALFDEIINTEENNFLRKGQ